MKTVISEKAEVEKQAANHIRRLLESKPDAVLGLTAGRSTGGLYALLCRMCAQGELSFAKARLFAVTEFVGAGYGDSCRAVLERELLGGIDAEPGNIFFPDPENCAAYDQAIRDAGGLDMVVLGLGQNGHIGYNAPATPFDSRTHVQKLTDATRRQLAAAGRAAESISEKAVTMGIKTLTEARDIILLAFGPEKADPVFNMLYGRTDSYIPASFLQLPPAATVYLDPAAAEKL